eukprot:GAHX01001048.1.p1 GENE.GAHX01001048.1~~GAHX01001048.1.p1  ORF type:complete len:458 (-),score=36.02 GAHX01001048.1:832-2205(-)
MPRPETSKVDKINRYVTQYPREFMKTRLGQLWCILCNTSVTPDRLIFIKNHRDTMRHRTQLINRDITTIPSLLQTMNLKTDFIFMMLKCNVPLHNCDKNAFREFFKKYHIQIPSSSSSYTYVKKIGVEMLEKIKIKLENKQIFMIIDGSLIQKKHYTNVLVGDIEYPKTSYLVDVIVSSESTNSENLLGNIIDEISNLGIARNNFVQLITDAASYNLAATSSLYQIYRNLVYITCILHLLHNCVMKLKSYYKKTDKLIASIQASLSKSSEREHLFREIGKPPKVIVTRWGYWLEAARYYSRNFVRIKEIVTQYRDDGQIVSNAKSAVQREGLIEEIMELTQNYIILSDIKNLWTDNKPMVEEGVRILLGLTFGRDPVGIRDYITNRLNQNDVIRVYNWRNQPAIRDPSLTSKLLGAQASSIDVERSFSLLNSLMADDRNFLDENVRYYLMSYYNKDI